MEPTIGGAESSALFLLFEKPVRFEEESIVWKKEKVFCLKRIREKMKSKMQVSKNLLSFKDIRQNGYHIETTNEGKVEYLYITTIKAEKKYVLEKLPIFSSGLYYTSISIVESHAIVNKEFTNDFIIWHDRLGHSGYNMIRKIIENSHILQTKEFSCVACSQGKLIIRPSVIKVGVESPAFLERIQGDICGPIHPPCGPFRYYMFLIDASTRWSHVCLLSTRNLAFARLLAQLIRLRAQFSDYAIKTLCLDNAGEFMSQAFNDYCISTEITIEHPVAHVHTQNALAESLIKRLQLIARPMLMRTKLPISAWGHAILHAAVLCGSDPQVIIKSPQYNWLLVRNQIFPILEYLDVQPIGSKDKNHRKRKGANDLGDHNMEAIAQKEPRDITNDKTSEEVQLQKSLYGLKQLGRMWYNRLSEFLLKEWYKNDPICSCVFIRRSGPEFVIIAVYVDDLNIIGTSGELPKAVDYLKKEFEMKDLGKIKFYLGLQIEHMKDEILVHQSTYTEKILKHFYMDKAHPLSTPMVVRSLDINKDLFRPHENDGELLGDETLYLSAIGALIYLTNNTRPDITFAVSLLARFSSFPTTRHRNGVKHIFRYLRGTIDMKLFSSYESDSQMTGYADASYLSDPYKALSQTGYLFTCGGTTISWRSTKQTLAATSSNHTEIISIHEASRECV
ncbi:uncharacterized protein [Nicotiana tomentosiformis]|uniref:uncharacterized protein n=1 Tax=Nicotiana tomentosiformis TaxID=4098 RepID=UPI00388C64C5